MPRDRYVINRYNSRYYYSRGVWYQPRGPRFVVVGAPLGVFVPVLPYYYSSFYVGGMPYYYGNGAYYRYRDRERDYEVVDRPDGAPSDVEENAGTTSDEIFIYPKNGQSADRQSQDRFECHKWASGETGFDPTQSGGGVSADQNSSKRSDYNRAMTACLEGRGYSVK